jgi:hypothetical protein
LLHQVIGDELGHVFAPYESPRSLADIEPSALFWGTFGSSYPFLLLPAKGMVCDDDNSANWIPIHKLK